MRTVRNANVCENRCWHTLIDPGRGRQALYAMAEANPFALVALIDDIKARAPAAAPRSGLVLERVVCGLSSVS